ncbi:STAS/SEC14 domain-containing protein [bacterium]|nr:STAS/SEC14 domain-containing protein [bacterium]
MEYNGKKIMDNDLSGLLPEKFINKMNKFENAVISQNDRNLLVLSDIENAQFSPASMIVLKKIAGTTAPYIKKYAIVGVKGIKKILFKAVQVVSTTSLEAFDSLEEAKKWLVE